VFPPQQQQRISKIGSMQQMSHPCPMPLPPPQPQQQRSKRMIIKKQQSQPPPPPPNPPPKPPNIPIGYASLKKFYLEKNM